MRLVLTKVQNCVHQESGSKGIPEGVVQRIQRMYKVYKRVQNLATRSHFGPRNPGKNSFWHTKPSISECPGFSEGAG